MKIALYPIDSKIANLAAMKISSWHKKCGDTVEMLAAPIFSPVYDKVYVSKIFTYSKMDYVSDNWVIGGSGYDLSIKLPSEIEMFKPDYSLYPDMKYSLGFTTRGCIRKCKFCFVPEKEGMIKSVADIYDIWNGSHKKIVLLDNNILALPEHFFKITDQLLKEQLIVDFNQGLDHRLLTDDIIKRLREIKHFEYRFSFDDVKYEKSVLKAIVLLKKHGIKKSMWFVLVGFNSILEEDLYRLNLLRDNGQNVYVQRYNFVKGNEYVALARWANQHHIFAKIPFEEFLSDSRNPRWYKELVYQLKK